jgi:hypothetical protein
VTPDPAERAELLARARERLQASLDDLLGDRLRAGGRPPRDRAGWVEVRDADVVGRCAARFAHPEPSQWSDLTTVTATRTLGRLVLRERDPSESPDATLDRILAGADDLPAWLANGLEPLDRSAVAAVRASVLAWVADALTPVRGRTDLAWDGTTERVTVPGRAVQLVARWDARLGSRRSPTTLLVHSPRVVDRADDLVAAGFVALVACHRGDTCCGDHGPGALLRGRADRGARGPRGRAGSGPDHRWPVVPLVPPSGRLRGGACCGGAARRPSADLR